MRADGRTRILIQFQHFYGELISPATVNVVRSVRKVTDISSDFNLLWIFETDFRNSLQYQISRKSVKWELRWYTRTDGRTVMSKIICAFRDYAKARIKINLEVPRQFSDVELQFHATTKRSGHVYYRMTLRTVLVWLRTVLVSRGRQKTKKLKIWFCGL